VVDDDLAGFVHVMVEGTPYASPNYRWVAERYPTFAYIDRVAIAPNHRRAGIGARLYDAVVARWSSSAPRCGDAAL
jgi:uncharacterized protein